MTDREFAPFPKIPRLFRDMVVTEKIDGTNAAVVVTEDGDVYAQSRKRIITPADDNFGFAAWVEGNRDGLAAALGVGRHFGEWWGSGIQRGYGLPNGQRRFSLFNVSRHAAIGEAVAGVDQLVAGLDVVPVLYQGPFDVSRVEDVIELLWEQGSVAAPGFMRPEGVVVFHAAARTLFKVLLEGDDTPKSVAA